MTSSQSADEERPAVAQAHMIQQMSREAQEMKRRRRRRFQSQLMSNVEQEADNSKRKSEESDVVLKNQQMVRVQQMATVEWIQQKRKDKDSADDIFSRCFRAKIQKSWEVQLQAYRYHQLDNQTQATAHPVVSYNEPAVALCIQSQRSRRNDRIQQKRKAVRSVARIWKDDNLALTSAEQIWIHCPTTIFQTELIYSRSAIEEAAGERVGVAVRLSQKICCTVHQQRENEKKDEAIDRH
ncbi:hypothetical protein F511_16571 [Dorcoceras hygrometricum]|uniref:Uncharacterized protein n=1 Tax=Dorcoceras hygrometricum TaxID=472368 RepID=A0A2Z7B1R5_9LAMI|nr:hypothetical protein F511_16571 [Dorcoceras hygrometricum]